MLTYTRLTHCTFLGYFFHTHGRQKVTLQSNTFQQTYICIYSVISVSKISFIVYPVSFVHCFFSTTLFLLVHLLSSLCLFSISLPTTLSAASLSHFSTPFIQHLSCFPPHLCIISLSLTLPLIYSMSLSLSHTNSSILTSVSLSLTPFLQHLSLSSLLYAASLSCSFPHIHSVPLSSTFPLVQHPSLFSLSSGQHFFLTLTLPLSSVQCLSLFPTSFVQHLSLSPPAICAAFVILSLFSSHQCLSLFPTPLIQHLCSVFHSLALSFSPVFLSLSHSFCSASLPFPTICSVSLSLSLPFYLFSISLSLSFPLICAASLSFTLISGSFSYFICSASLSLSLPTHLCSIFHSLFPPICCVSLSLSMQCLITCNSSDAILCCNPVLKPNDVKYNCVQFQKIDLII